MDAGLARQIYEWVMSFSEDDLRKQGWTAQQLIETCLESKSRLLFRRDGSKIASLISYQKIAPGQSEVLFLATSPDRQKQGFMSGLLDEFLSRCKGQEVWLECREDNLSARHLYLKKGFRETGYRPHYYKDGSAAILFNFLPD